MSFPTDAREMTQILHNCFSDADANADADVDVDVVAVCLVHFALFASFPQE